MEGESATGGAPEAARGEVEIVEPGALEQSFARRVAESKATIPHAYVETEAELAGPPATADVLRAAAVALGEFPRVNAAYRDGRFELYSRVNIAFAVAAQGSLVFPVIPDADEKPVGAIASEMEALARRAREGSITQPEVAGATFSIADPGAHGVTRALAVINRGQAAIMTVGAPRQQALERDGRLVTAHILTLALAFDHRILQGPEPPQFLARVRSLLAEPEAGAAAAETT